MDIKKFEELKNKLTAAKTKKDRAEGSLEQIKVQLKKDFGLNSIEEAEEKERSLKLEIEKGEMQIAELFKQLESVTDWENL